MSNDENTNKFMLIFAAVDISVVHSLENCSKKGCMDGLLWVQLIACNPHIVCSASRL